MQVLVGWLCEQVMLGDMDSKTKMTRSRYTKSGLNSLQLECLLVAYTKDPTQEGRAVAILYRRTGIWLWRNQSRRVL